MRRNGSVGCQVKSLNSSFLLSRAFYFDSSSIVYFAMPTVIHGDFSSFYEAIYSYFSYILHFLSMMPLKKPPTFWITIFYVFGGWFFIKDSSPKGFFCSSSTWVCVKLTIFFFTLPILKRFDCLMLPWNFWFSSLRSFNSLSNSERCNVERI